MKNIKKYIPIIGIILFIIIDQILKVLCARDLMLIEGVLKFSNVKNTGGAFGIFNTNIIMMIILNIFLILFMIRFIISKRKYMNKKVYIGLLFLIAGGISNLIDRVFRGFVVDYIDFTQIIDFPVFNLADIVLVVGWILLIIGILKDINKGV